MQFHLETMTCGGCVRGVTKAIQSVDGAAKVSADLPSRLVDVNTTAQREDVAEALTQAGFAPA